MRGVLIFLSNTPPESIRAYFSKCQKYSISTSCRFPSHSLPFPFDLSLHRNKASSTLRPTLHLSGTADAHKYPPCTHTEQGFEVRAAVNGASLCRVAVCRMKDPWDCSAEFVSSGERSYKDLLFQQTPARAPYLLLYLCLAFLHLFVFHWTVCTQQKTDCCGRLPLTTAS